MAEADFSVMVKGTPCLKFWEDGQMVEAPDGEHNHGGHKHKSGVSVTQKFDIAWLHK